MPEHEELKRLHESLMEKHLPEGRVKELKTTNVSHGDFVRWEKYGRTYMVSMMHEMGNLDAYIEKKEDVM